GPLCARRVLRRRRPAALLDGDFAALRSEHDLGAEAGAARVEARSAGEGGRRHLASVLAELAVDGLVAARAFVPGKVGGTLEPALDESLRRREHVEHRGGEILDRGWIEIPGCVAADLRQRTAARDRDRAPRGHGLERRL